MNSGKERRICDLQDDSFELCTRVGRASSGGEASWQTAQGWAWPLRRRSITFVVAPQTAGGGGVSGDGLSTYNNPNDPAFNGGTLYQDGVDGVYVRFQVCNGTNDFVLNLRST